MEIMTFIIAAVLIEGIVTYFKEIFQNKKINFWQLISLLVGVAVCLTLGFDLLPTLGIESPVPYIGNVITAFVVSRGSNYVYDFITTLNKG